jgi:hypothetical protein
LNEKQFISEWIRKLEAEPIKLFPEDFYLKGESEEYSLPGRGLLIGKEFFGEFEILTVDGEEVLRVVNYEKAKFIIYSNRNQPQKINIPSDRRIIKEMTLSYEKYLDSIVRRIEKNYKKEFTTSKTFSNVLADIFKRLNLIRLH